ncbi:unnamed protein product [Orchesella dallaii]|uniref:Uncharacterized protein n=1 Tax=Orchesella dallaii TaxID=48710 RepID=A0ABP1RJ74_9HEXA
MSSKKKTRSDPQVGMENVARPDTESESGDVVSQSVAPFVASNVREIWLNIFEKLKPQDKVTFLKTFPEWHDWAAPKRTLVLFHEITPMLLETLPKHTSLQLRQLFRQWTQDLDKQHPSHPDHLRLAFEKERAIDGPPLPQYICRFETAEQVQKFLDENQNHPGNPFPGRTIFLRQKQVPGSIFQPGYIQLFQEYWNKVGEMLLQFGSHVHFATIHCFERFYETRNLESFEIVRNYLVNLPHLKRLKIVGNYEASLMDVREFLETNSVPQLADLETLELHGISSPLINAILNSCPVPSNIKRLCFNFNAGDLDDDPPDLCNMLEKFTNLEALELTNLCTGDYERFSHLRSLEKLTHLNLGFWKDGIHAKPFFDCLAPFGMTLTHLKMKSGFDISNSVRTTINLPHLERLDMALCEGNLDPLLQLKSSLTFLRIDKCIQRKKDKKYESAIDVYGFEKRMYESNIWKVMPTLQTIIIRKKLKYDRQTYEKPGKK